MHSRATTLAYLVILVCECKAHAKRHFAQTQRLCTVIWGGMQVVRRWFDEVFNEENMEALAEITTEDIVVNDPCSWNEPFLGRERLQKVIEEYIVAYKSLTFSVDSVLAEPDGSQVLAKWDAQAMHLGSFMGAPPSGRVEHISGMTAFRLIGRKISRIDCFRQALAQERQNSYVDYGL